MSYDLFISYKTENSNPVRAIADCLIANGLRVWFAEYEITGEIYDDPDAVQAAIDAGIDSSRHAIVFTNNRWAESPHCSREMDRIERRIANTRTVEVRIPTEDLPRAKWPVLERVPDIEYSNDLEEVLRFINEQRWFTQSLRLMEPRFDSEPNARLARMRFGITMNTGPLKDAYNLQALLSERQRRFPGEIYYFEGDVDSHRVRLLVNVNPHRTALGELSISERGNVDDFATLKKYRHFAAQFVEDQNRECFGIHLVFLAERSNLGITSADKRILDGERDWERRYALLLRDPNGRDAGELDICFNTMLPADDDQASKREFCRLARAFDSAVYDLTYAPNKSLLSGEALRIVIAKAALVALAASVHDYVGTQYLSSVAHSVTAFLLGLFGADLVIALLSHESRRNADLSGMMFGPRTRVFPTYGRLLDQLWNIVVGTLLSSLMMASAGLLNPITIIVGLIAVFQKVSSPLFWGLFGAGMYVLGEMTDRAISKRSRTWR